MNKANLIAVIVIVFLSGLVFGSFAGLTDIASGRSIRSVETFDSTTVTSGPIISIYPDIASVNDIMTGTVAPGDNGALAGIKFYALDDFGNPSRLVNDCPECFCTTGRACYDEQNYQYILPAQFSAGYYSACAVDAITAKQACAVFEVV